MCVLVCCPQIFSFCLDFLNLPPQLSFLSKWKRFQTGLTFYIVFPQLFSLLPLFGLVFPLTSFILLSIEILLKAVFLKSLPVFVGIAFFAFNLQLFAQRCYVCFSVLHSCFSFCLGFLNLPPCFKVHLKCKVLKSLSSRVLCHSLGCQYYRFSFKISLLVHGPCFCLWFFFCSLISVGFSLVNVHVFVFHSILATFCCFSRTPWLCTLSFYISFQFAATLLFRLSLHFLHPPPY